MSEINNLPTKEDVIKRYAEVQEISLQEANEQIGAETVEEILFKIKEKTIEKINKNRHPLNRAQRRARNKKLGAKRLGIAEEVSDTAIKLSYIDLIQKLRELNEKKKGEVYDEDSEESNV